MPGVQGEGDIPALEKVLPQSGQRKDLTTDRLAGFIHPVIQGVDHDQRDLVTRRSGQSPFLHMARLRPTRVPFGGPAQLMDGLTPAGKITHPGSGGAIQFLEMGQGQNPVGENAVGSGCR